MKNSLYWHVSSYIFTPIDKQLWQTRLKTFLHFFDIKGTILISTEGINISLSLSPVALTALQRFLTTFQETKNMVLKKTTAHKHCFSRLLVLKKKHIIPFPYTHDQKGQYISAEKLDKNYRDFVLLDVRNHYEFRVGSLKNAHHFDIQHFMDLPEQMQQAPEAWKKKKVVIFCTGGVRCEKVTPLMESLGFEDIYQLEGGVIEYLRNTKETNWKGECFTFDNRVSLTPSLKEGSFTLCYACREPLSPDDLTHPDFKSNKSCQYCVTKKRSQRPLEA
ncbi:MAG: rhodanese-like domain-containing protein [Alphaproteobacteria bacterium]|nr:rhodanese-like domain-containing protein [Alphaproteobacteria bacterium]